jgi:hypothetical protein
MADHKFLTVAVWAGRLSSEQAHELFLDQQQASSYHRVRLKVGELAVNKKFMTRDAVALTLQEQEKQRDQNTFYRDIISEIPRHLLAPQKFDPQLVNVLRGATGLVIVGILFLSWLLTDHDWDVVARAAHFIVVGWLVLELVVPLLVNRRLPRSRRIAWKRLPERITPVLVLAGLSYMASFMGHVQSTPSGFRYWHTSLSFWVSVTVTLTIYLATYGARRAAT